MSIRVERLFFGRSLHSKLHRLEALLGLILACFFALGIVFVGPVWIANGLMYDRPPLPIPKAIVIGVSWLVLMYWEYRTLQRYVDGLEGDAEPISVHVAMTLPRFTALVRPLVAFWWLAHGVAIVATAEFLQRNLKFEYPSSSELIYQQVIQATIILAAAFASNTFFLCFFAILFQSESLVRTIWRIRLLIDVLIVLALYHHW